MSGAYKSRSKQHLPIELVEADVEIAFNLVDLAEAETALGRADDAKRAIGDAEVVLADIQQRLLRLDPSESIHFGPLVDEVRRAIDLARSHQNDAGANGV